MILLDTRAAIWFVTDDPALGVASRATMDEALTGNALAVSAVSFWEIAMLIAERRLRATAQPTSQRATILGAGIRELELTGDIAILSVELGGLHGDPGDRFIAATAIVHGATLMTADARLLAWRHPLPRMDAAA